jgi:hypothetical protein
MNSGYLSAGIDWSDQVNNKLKELHWRNRIVAAPLKPWGRGKPAVLDGQSIVPETRRPTRITESGDVVVFHQQESPLYWTKIFFNRETSGIVVLNMDLVNTQILFENQGLCMKKYSMFPTGATLEREPLFVNSYCFYLWKLCTRY